RRLHHRRAPPFARLVEHGVRQDVVQEQLLRDLPRPRELRPGREREAEVLEQERGLEVGVARRPVFGEEGGGAATRLAVLFLRPREERGPAVLAPRPRRGEQDGEAEEENEGEAGEGS